MQPELPPDTNPPQTPPGNTGFFAKVKAIFKNKVASPADPEPQSHTPAPELDEEADRNMIPTDEPDQNTTGFGAGVFATRESGVDDEGQRTAPEIDVPDDLLNKGEDVKASSSEAPDGVIGDLDDEPMIRSVRSEQRDQSPNQDNQ